MQRSPPPLPHGLSAASVSAISEQIGLGVCVAALCALAGGGRTVRVLPSMGERVTSEFLDNWKKDDSIKLRISVILKIYGRVLGMK